MNRYIYPLMLAAMIPAAGKSQELNSEITVTHQVVPEEQAATRLRLLPTVSLPKVSPGRLAMASSATKADLSPEILTLEPSKWATELLRSKQRGYATLAYGPLWNLDASAGYRVVNRDSLQVDAFMQFNGYKYTSEYPDNFFGDNRTVQLRRNTGLIGARTQWISTAGTLNGSLIYDFSNYNMPFPVRPTTVNANRANVNLGWNGAIGKKADYRVGLDYTLLGFGYAGNPTHNAGTVDVAANWHHSSRSHWGLTLRQTLMHSSAGANKGVTHVEPSYMLTSPNLTLRIAAALDIRNGNVSYKYGGLVVPKFDLTWRPTSHFTLWGRTDGRLETNSRAMLYDIQPYLRPEFEAGFSRIFTADAGLTLGPWAGASIGFFGGYAWSNNWMIPDDGFGEMHGVNICGAHWGGELNYDYRSYLSLKVRAEMAQGPVGEYTTGYALWGDHAKLNLIAAATVRPIESLYISLSYHLRTSRNKLSTMMPNGYQNLMNINKLNATVGYAINRNWTVFVNGENLLNRHWYLGPAIPSQGIAVMAGVEYKF